MWCRSHVTDEHDAFIDALRHIFDLATLPTTCSRQHVVGENPPYGILGGTVETSASFEARYAPPFYPTRAIVLPDRRLFSGRMKCACGSAQFVCVFRSLDVVP